jgi:hypothetical protein
VTAAKTCDMTTTAVQARDAGRMARVTARQSTGAATNMTVRQSMRAGANMAARYPTRAAANMGAAEMATTHSATKVTTAAEVATAAAMSASTATATATASEGLCLYGAHSQSDNRKDDSNLAQHHILHLGSSRVPISGYCRHFAPSGTLWPDQVCTW